MQINKSISKSIQNTADSLCLSSYEGQIILLVIGDNSTFIKDE